MVILKIDSNFFYYLSIKIQILEKLKTFSKIITKQMSYIYIIIQISKIHYMLLTSKIISSIIDSEKTTETKL